MFRSFRSEDCQKREGSKDVPIFCHLSAQVRKTGKKSKVLLIELINPPTRVTGEMIQEERETKNQKLVRLRRNLFVTDPVGRVI